MSVAARDLFVLVLTALAIVAGACSAPSGVGLRCVATANCPGELSCIEGVCDVAQPRDAPTDEPARRRALPEVPSLIGRSLPDDDEPPADPHPVDPNDPVDPDDPNDPNDPNDPIDPAAGWTVVAYDVPLYDKPRVVLGTAEGTAGVEVYFLEGTVGSGATCDGLTRAFPDGSLDPLAGPINGCFKEMDAQRTADGVVHVVMRNSFTEYSDVVFADFGPELLTDVAFEPEAYDEHRGVRARIALTPDGDPDWLWSVRQASGPDLIEQLHATTERPNVVAEVDGLVDDLDYLVDSEGYAALFLTDLTEEWLLLRTRGENLEVSLGVSGAIEAVRCGGAMHVVYRKGDDLVVARAVGTTVTSRTVVAEGLSSARTRGDVAIACDAGAVWTAWTDAGAAHVAPLGGPIEIAGAGGGGIALAVVDGAPHVAFGSSSVNGELRYATRP